MMIFALLLGAVPAPLSLEPFRDEESAAHALDADMKCLAEGVFARMADSRETKVLANEVVTLCANKSAVLQTQLADVHRRKPNILPVGKNAEDAASLYVRDLNSRTELTVLEFRQKK